MVFVDRKKEYDKNWINHRRSIKRQAVFEYFQKHWCIDCGERDPIVLEFDHVDRTKKVNTVSAMIRSGTSIETMMLEIAKCVVRCANCHRRRTYSEQTGSWRLTFTGAT